MNTMTPRKSAPRKSPGAAFLRGFVRFYQYFISPLTGPNCRYAPTCSEYAMDALEKHGALKGTWLALRRLSRCHPLGGSGYDPVPEGRPHHHDEHCGHDPSRQGNPRAETNA